MKICNKKAVELTPEQEEEIRIQSYFDRITPSVLRFYPDYYICGKIIALCGQSENMRRKRRNRQSCHILQTTKMLR